MRFGKILLALAAGWFFGFSVSAEPAVDWSIALVGDSLSTSFHLDTNKNTILMSRANSRQFQNWFLDTDPSTQSIRSFSERLATYLGADLQAINLSRVGSFISGVDASSGLKELVLGSQSLGDQIKDLNKLSPFPSLILLWIGHNNVDYKTWTGMEGISSESQRYRFDTHARAFGRSYRQELEPLLVRATREKKRIAIVVLGLVNFESFFTARGQIEKTRKAGTYPFLEKSQKSFISMAPEARAGMIELARRMNDRLQREVELRAKTLPAHLRLVYSDALATVDIDAAATLRTEDAWHPSVLGHNRLAERVFLSPEMTHQVLPFLSGVPELKK